MRTMSRKQRRQQPINARAEAEQGGAKERLLGRRMREVKRIRHKERMRQSKLQQVCVRY